MPKIRPPEFLRRAAYSRSIVSQKMIETMTTPLAASKRLGISCSGLYKKQKQPALFRVGELASLAELTGMTDEEIVGVVMGRRVTK